MAYSELANWDGSLDRLNAERTAAAASASADIEIKPGRNSACVEPDPNSYIIPQHEIDEFIAADDADCASVERDEPARATANENRNVKGETSERKIERENENECGGEGSEGDDDNWDAPDRHTDASSGMEVADDPTPVRVHRKKRRRDTGGSVETAPEKNIVIARTGEPRLPTPNADSPAAGQHTVSTAADQPGPSNPAAQNNIRLKSGSVKRTYAGPRKIRDASESSEIAKPASGELGLRTDEHRSSAPTRHSQKDQGAAEGSRDAAVGSLRLEGSSSQTPSRKQIKTYGRSSGPSRSRSTGDPTPPSKQRKPEEHAKNPFYASLSNAINGQRQQALKHATLLRKPSISRPAQSKTSPPESERSAQHRKLPREMFKSVDEHIAEEEKEKKREKKEKQKKRQKSKEDGDGGSESEDEKLRRRKEQRKERRREWMKEKQLNEARSKRSQTAARIQGGQMLDVGPPKRNRSSGEAIYISSGSEGPVAGPSRISPASKKRAKTNTKRRVQDEHIVPIPIVSSSGDEYAPSDCNPPRGISTRSKTSTNPESMLPLKRLRKKKETIVVSSDSESDAVFVENALQPSTSPLRQPRSEVSTTTPLRTMEARKRSTGRDRMEADDKDGGQINSRNGGEDARSMNEPAVKDSVKKAIDDVYVPRGEITKPSSTTQKENASATETSKDPNPTEIVVKPRYPMTSSNNRSTQPRSPTLCLSRDPSRHGSQSPSSRSTTLAAPEDQPTGKLPDASGDELNLDNSKTRITPDVEASKDGTVQRVENANGDGTTSPSEDSESGEEGAADSEISSSSDELDETCHRCRNRNIYAKMKCVKVKKADTICPLHFCHRCIAVFFPKVAFDPWSVSFVCPACTGTCDCINCCKKRGDHTLKHHRTNRVRVEDLGITLLLSPQETRRRDRAARGIIVEPKKPKSRSSKMTKPNGEKLSVERVENIGEEAEDWIRRQSVGKQKVRAFVGSWQEAWGPTPFCVHEMDGIDFDVHAVTGMGKGKGKAVDPSARLYVGNRQGLDRPFERAEDVTVDVPDREPSPPPKRRPGRPKKRKPEPGDIIYVTPANIPGKKRRKTDQITIPEFTMNHQDAGSSNATSPFYQPTPDDFGPFHGLEVNGETKYPGITHDPMLGAVDGPYSSDPLGVDMYAPDWDNVAMSKPLAMEGFGETDFSYQGTYDSYAAALGGGAGLESYGYADAFHVSAMKIGKQNEVGLAGPGLNQDQLAKQQGLAQIIDPALMEPEHDPSQLSEQNDALDGLDPESDPTRFLTPSARASATPTLLSVPMIYGVPSSTGLSLLDLQRTMRESLSALTCSLS